MARPTVFSSKNFQKDIEQLCVKYKRLSNIEKSKVFGNVSFNIGSSVSLHHMLDGFICSFGEELVNRVSNECSPCEVPVPKKRARKKTAK